MNKIFLMGLLWNWEVSNGVRRWVALVLLLIIGTPFLGCATTGLQSELILNDEYFQAAHREIQNAKESIYLIA